MDRMWEFAARLAMLSFFSIGGANVVLPEIHRYVVLQQHWMTDADFSSLVALSQAAPGPNVLVVAVLGLQVGGLAMAAVSLLAFVLPSSIVTFCIAHFGRGLERASWTRLVRRAIAPLTAGLVMANGYILTRAASERYVVYLITLAAALLAIRYRVNPVWIVFGAGAAGVVLAA